MQAKKEGNLLFVKLEHNEPFFETLKKALEQSGVTSGVIVSGVGMLTNFKLGYYSGGKYHVDEFNEPMELTSMLGNVAKANDELVLHVHVTLANKEKKVFGGHLIDATVWNVNEILIVVLDEIKLKRKRNEATGLLELYLE